MIIVKEHRGKAAKHAHDTKLVLGMRVASAGVDDDFLRAAPIGDLPAEAVAVHRSPWTSTGMMPRLLPR